MSGDSYQIKFDHDFCFYTRTAIRSAAGNFTVKLKLTDADRKKILNRLRELKVEKIKSPNSESAPVAVNDGYSKSLCIGQTCMSGDSDTRLAEDDNAIFSNVCNFLVEFANEKYTKRK
jgi:hypothetical protein